MIHFERSDKLDNDLQYEKTILIFFKFEVFHFDISGKDKIDLHL